MASRAPPGHVMLPERVRELVTLMLEVVIEGRVKQSQVPLGPFEKKARVSVLFFQTHFSTLTLGSSGTGNALNTLKKIELKKI